MQTRKAGWVIAAQARAVLDRLHSHTDLSYSYILGTALERFDPQRPTPVFPGPRNARVDAYLTADQAGLLLRWVQETRWHKVRIVESAVRQYAAEFPGIDPLAEMAGRAPLNPAWQALLACLHLPLFDAGQRALLMAAVDIAQRRVDWPHITHLTADWSAPEQLVLRIAHALFNGGAGVALTDLEELEQDTRMAVIDIIRARYR